MNEGNTPPSSDGITPQGPEPDGATPDFGTSDPNYFKSPADVSPLPMQPARVNNVGRPRAWTSVVVAVLSILAALVVSGVALPAGLFALGIVDLGSFSDLGGDPSSVLGPLLEHPAGIWILVLPGQLTFIAIAFLCATLSPESVPERLAMRAGNLPVWKWLVLAIATPTVGLISGLLVMQFAQEPSPHLQMMEDLLTSKTGLGLVVMVLLVSVLPGIAEELIFRGYVQSRLLKCWPPVAAILVSAALFAAAHVDPMHALGVFPLGIWLGIVAWRTGSLWPAMLCHAYNNMNAIVAAQFGAEGGDELTTAQMAIFMPCLFAMVFAIGLLLRNPQSGASGQLASTVVDERLS